MSVFIDQTGKYYQADTAKDSGDAKIEFPDKFMLEYLTATPVTMPEFGTGVTLGEIEKLAVPVTIAAGTEGEEHVDEKSLRTL